MSLSPTTLIVSYRLKYSRCPKHAKTNKDNHPCKLTECGKSPITVYDINHNLTGKVADVFCGDVKCKIYNLIKHFDKFAINEQKGDYIKSNVDWIIIGRHTIATYTLYSTLNLWSMTKPGEGPGKWQTKLINNHYEALKQKHRKLGHKFNHKSVQLEATQNVLSRYYLTKIYHDLFVKNWLSIEKRIEILNYRMGTESIAYDWTFDSVKNIWDIYDVNGLDETQVIGLVTKQMQNILAAWFCSKNNYEFILTLKPTPKASEKHEYFISDLVEDVENILHYSEKDIVKLILKCDGLKANIGVPEKIWNELLEKHGDIFEGYDLIKLLENVLVCCVFSNFHQQSNLLNCLCCVTKAACDPWHRKKLLWSKKILTRKDPECMFTLYLSLFIDYCNNPTVILTQVGSLIKIEHQSEFKQILLEKYQLFLQLK